MGNKNNDPIRIRQFTPAQLKLFNPKDEFLGLMNNFVEQLRVRLSIAEQQLSGYYMMYGGFRINITPEGGVESWPEGLYREELNLCIKIRNIQVKRTEEE